MVTPAEPPPRYGNCPNCGEMCATDAPSCPSCKAIFSEDAGWRPVVGEEQDNPQPSARRAQAPNPTRSRGIYIILALFLGLIGIHNFYAGHNKVGLFQLLITLALGWVYIGLVITGIWVLLDIVTTTEDGDGAVMT
jgi:TM2 domain-containing membrane protein YozV